MTVMTDLSQSVHHVLGYEIKYGRYLLNYEKKF